MKTQTNHGAEIALTTTKNQAVAPSAHGSGPNFEHTPGPWKASKGWDDEPDRWVVLAAKEMAWHIATIENGQPGDCCDTEGATARLIAAAPEMLAALKGWLSHLDSAEDDPNNTFAHEDQLMESMRAAVAKALGQNSTDH